jgi:hypothetical protein
MAFPNTDYPATLDSLQSRVNLVDIAYAEDFNYQDNQIRKVQTLIGSTGQLIGQGIASSGPGGLVSPLADGVGVSGITLALRPPFYLGNLLSVGDNYDSFYDEKLWLDADGNLSIVGVLETANSGITGAVGSVDATPQQMWTKSFIEGVAAVVTATVVGISVGGDAAAYKRAVLAKRATGGSLVIVGTQKDLMTEEDQAAWDCFFDMSSNTLRLNVQGAAATTITWSSVVEFTEVGS